MVPSALDVSTDCMSKRFVSDCVQVTAANWLKSSRARPKSIVSLQYSVDCKAVELDASVNILPCSWVPFSSQFFWAGVCFRFTGVNVINPNELYSYMQDLATVLGAATTSARQPKHRQKRQPHDRIEVDTRQIGNLPVMIMHSTCCASAGRSWWRHWPVS